MLGLKLLLTMAVFWHTLSFAAGGVYAFLAYRALFVGGYDRGWTRVLRSADWQLWASGFLIIGLGMALSSIQHYLQNPKLIAKIIVIVTWLISTQVLRHVGFGGEGKSANVIFQMTSSVNVACWLYGAFLGVAKPLAYGVVPLYLLVTGFIMTIIASCLVTLSAKALLNQRADALKQR